MNEFQLDPSAFRRLRLLIAFDGAGYHGWQSGRSGRGVADVLQRVLAESLGVTDDVVSSSRTDSGVHAFGLVAHADVPLRHAGRRPDAVRSMLNGLLPPDIRVREAVWTDAAFHARFGAKWKEYRYVIWNDPVMNPLKNGSAWHVPGELDVDAMRRAAGLLVGRHDFRAFTTKRDGVLGDSARNMRRLAIRRSGREVGITLCADGFLYKMCRVITGTLVHVGCGKMDAEDVIELLEKSGVRMPGAVAPAHGLTLWKVGY